MTDLIPLDLDGFLLLRGVFTPEDAADLAGRIEAALARAAPIQGGDGTVYAARNVTSALPDIHDLWRRRPALRDPLRATLGPGLGLVRALYFDKPPGNSWALPWHKDVAIAVRDNRLPTTQFAHPTRKAAVPHVEAPVAVLEGMLTARIHLDEVTEENGPLKVVPGSHRLGKALELDGRPVTTVTCAAGDVLLMRPLVAHCSNRSAPSTTRHRRVLHLEFAPSSPLPDSYVWHEFAGDADFIKS